MLSASDAYKMSKKGLQTRIDNQVKDIEKKIKAYASNGSDRMVCEYELYPEVVEILKLNGYKVRSNLTRDEYTIIWDEENE